MCPVLILLRSSCVVLLTFIFGNVSTDEAYDFVSILLQHLSDGVQEMY